MNSYQALLNAVKMIPSHVESAEGCETFKGGGICSLLDYVIQAFSLGDECEALDDIDWIESVLDAVFIKWPEYSGDVNFPVPASNGKGPLMAASAWLRHDKWTGEYGESRRRLLQFLIEDLTAQVTEQSVA